MANDKHAFERITLVVLDSLGMGEMPDAAAWGDAGADTLGHICESREVRLPNLRGWGLGLNIPVVLMIGYRGWTRHGVTTDTAAVYTERFLNAFGINYYLVESDADAARISVAFDEAKKNKRPVAVLVGDEYHGFNK